MVDEYEEGGAGDLGPRAGSPIRGKGETNTSAHPPHKRRQEDLDDESEAPKRGRNEMRGDREDSSSDEESIGEKNPLFLRQSRRRVHYRNLRLRQTNEIRAHYMARRRSSGNLRTERNSSSRLSKEYVPVISFVFSAKAYKQRRSVKTKTCPIFE